MKKLEYEIELLKKDVKDLYGFIIELQIQNIELKSKLKDMEDFWYED